MNFESAYLHYRGTRMKINICTLCVYLCVDFYVICLFYVYMHGSIENRATWTKGGEGADETAGGGAGDEAPSDAPSDGEVPETLPDSAPDTAPTDRR